MPRRTPNAGCSLFGYPQSQHRRPVLRACAGKWMNGSGAAPWSCSRPGALPRPRPGRLAPGRIRVSSEHPGRCIGDGNGTYDRADVPGFNEKNLEVRVTPRSVCILGKREDVGRAKDGNLIVERRASKNQISRGDCRLTPLVLPRMHTERGVTRTSRFFSLKPGRPRDRKFRFRLQYIYRDAPKKLGFGWSQSSRSWPWAKPLASNNSRARRRSVIHFLRKLEERVAVLRLRVSEKRATCVGGSSGMLILPFLGMVLGPWIRLS